MIRDYEKELITLLIAKRVCVQTKEIYFTKLRQYLGFCYHEGLLPEEMPHAGLLQFLSEAKSESDAKQRKALLGNLYEFILQQGYKLLGLPNPKQRIKVPESLSPSEIQRLFDAVPKTLEGSKQCLILKIIYACGLRISEAVKISTKDFRKKLNTKTGKEYFELKVTGKGIKERVVPIPDQTMNEIITHIEDRQIEGYLFKGQFSECYSTASVRAVFKRAKIKAGITTPGKTHLLRKSRTTLFVDAQINDRTIMQFFGWENQKTINHYHRASTSAMKNAIDDVDLLVHNSNQLKLQSQKQLKAS